MVGVAVAVFLAFAWGLRNLAAGRAVYATGSDPEAARLAGRSAEGGGLRRLRRRWGRLTALAALLNVPSSSWSVDPKTGTGAGNAGDRRGRWWAARRSRAGGGRWSAPSSASSCSGRSRPALVLPPRRRPSGKRRSRGRIILLAVASDGFARRGPLMIATRAGRDRASNCSPDLLAAARGARRAHGLVEVAVGTNFLTLGNALEVLPVRASRWACWPIALTPVIVGGGIDLSVGSLDGALGRRLRQALARPRPADLGRGGGR